MEAVSEKKRKKTHQVAFQWNIQISANILVFYQHLPARVPIFLNPMVDGNFWHPLATEAFENPNWKVQVDEFWS